MKTLFLFHPEQDFDALKSKGVSIVAFLDEVRPRKDGTFTVRFRIIYNRYPKYFSTKINLNKKDWIKLNGERPSGDIKSKKIILFELYRKALKVIYELDEFSFDEFSSRFARNESKIANVFDMYRQYIKDLDKEGRVGSKVVYEYSLKSMELFTGKSKLSFVDVTPKFLSKYESYMTSKGKSPTTIAMYLRCLRYLCNKAIADGVMNQRDYPFTKDGKDKIKYQLPEPRNNKIALGIHEIGEIFNYKPPEGSSEHYFRDLWLFSYLCNGINMKDICLLKYKDIHSDHIYFRRAKTERTDRKSRPIDVIITDEVKHIIDWWGNRPVLAESYIFPILKKRMSPGKEQATIKQAIKQTNKYIKRIANNIGIEENVHFQVARHSYATVLKRSGVSVEFISENLGHKNLSTTNHYLASFEDDQKKEIAKHLTAFNTNSDDSSKKIEKKNY